MLEQFIKKIKFSKKQTNLDVRAKLIYRNKPGYDVVICTDGFNIQLNGTLVKRNKYLLKFILSMIPNEQMQ